MGLRFVTGQRERRDEVVMRRIIVRIDRDRPAGRFDRPIVLLEPEIGRRSLEIKILQ